MPTRTVGTRGPRNVPVAVFMVCRDVYLRTDGSGTDVYVEVEVPELEELAPFIGSIQAVTITEQSTVSHRWKLVVKGSNDRRSYFPSTPNDVFSYISGDGHTSESELSTATVLNWRYLKFSLANSNSSGTAIESATVSVWLIVNWKS